MSTTKVQLLQAAASIVGGHALLALRLGISEAMLKKYLSGAFDVPDALFLRAVDLVLADRDSVAPAAPPGNGATSHSAPES